MARNTVDEIVTLSRLTLDRIQASEFEQALSHASAEVEFVSPVSDSDRSERSEALRKRAEAMLAVAFLYSMLAPFLSLSIAGKQILTTLNISIGTDFPTPVDFQNAMSRAADNYRTEGLRLLRMIKPITSTLRAGAT